MKAADPPDDDVPGAFEQLVLLAVARLQDDGEAYGMTVRHEITVRTGRAPSLGAVYATLERLEKKGYVSGRSAAGGSERAGRPRRLLRVEPVGMRALRRALDLIDRMRVDVKGLEPIGAGR